MGWHRVRSLISPLAQIERPNLFPRIEEFQARYEERRTLQEASQEHLIWTNN